MTKIGFKLIKRGGAVRMPLLLCIFLLFGFVKGALAASPQLIRICAARDGSNTLYWKIFSDTCSSVKQINVYAKENQFSNFKLLDSVLAHGQYEYVHKSANAFNRAEYYIEYVLLCGASETKVISDTLKVDTEAPGIIEPDSVSVAADGSIIVGWSPERSTDTRSYIVYRFSNGRNFPLDTLEGKFNTSYSDSVKGSANVYRLAVTDSCNNISPIGSFHQTMSLAVGMDSCKAEVYLNWTAYVGWDIKEYEIYASVDKESSFKLIGTTTGRSFTFTEAENKKDYVFVVRAVKATTGSRITSSTNRVTLKTLFGGELDHIYLSNVSVKDGHLLLTWLVSNPQVVDRYELWRGYNTTQVRKIATLAGTATEYVDMGADVNNDEFLYYLKVYNTCGKYGGMSNVSGNIVVRLSRTADGKILSWNPYQNWAGGVRMYTVYRNVNLPGRGFEYIGTTAANELIFSDTDSIDTYDTPGVCYEVRAIEGDDPKYDIRSVSYSNTICYEDAPQIFIPNAFHPDGTLNKVFAPKMMRVDESRSTMRIYNRWGELIFETQDLTHGWDGTVDGKMAPEGMYLYQFVIRGVNGLLRSYKGSLLLL